MNSSHVIDAHVLIWFLAGDARLSRDAQSVLDDSDARLFLPASALAEACMAVERGRTVLRSTGQILTCVENDPRISVVALDVEIVRDATTLIQLPDLHDRFIVATTRAIATRTESDAVLITYDRQIIASGLAQTMV